uniref:Eyes absent homolog n=1 Tax=Angiostrongylus cantonensis TaxID=6313 RepID=A0A158P8G7_ANGCA
MTSVFGADLEQHLPREGSNQHDFSRPLTHPGQNPYYNSGYGAGGYGVYGGASATASYYQQVATGLRVQNASFPYAIGTATPSTYYGSSYPTSFDYSAYNPQYYNGMRAGYYGNALAAGASAYTGLVTVAYDFLFQGGKSAKKKKTDSCSPADTHFARVFVWELDDICTLSTTSLNEVARKAPQYSRAAALLQNLSARVVALSFPSDQLDDTELCNVEDAALEESLGDSALGDGRGGVEVMRRMASKYLALRQLYLECALKPDAQVCDYALLERCGMSAQKEEINEARRQLELLFGGRSEIARRCLEVVAQRTAVSSEKYANVVLCADPLVLAVVQLLLAGLAPVAPIENVYSTNKTGRLIMISELQNFVDKSAHKVYQIPVLFSQGTYMPHAVDYCDATARLQ